MNLQAVVRVFGDAWRRLQTAILIMLEGGVQRMLVRAVKGADRGCARLQSDKAVVARLVMSQSRYKARTWMQFDVDLHHKDVVDAARSAAAETLGLAEDEFKPRCVVSTLNGTPLVVMTLADVSCVPKEYGGVRFVVGSVFKNHFQTAFTRYDLHEDDCDLEERAQDAVWENA